MFGFFWGGRNSGSTSAKHTWTAAVEVLPTVPAWKLARTNVHALERQFACACIRVPICVEYTYIHTHIYLHCVYAWIYMYVYLGVCRDAPPQTVTEMGICICICVYIYRNEKINIYINIYEEIRVSMRFWSNVDAACVSMSGHANCIPAPTPPASCTFTCLKGRWMRVTAVCAQQKPQHLNNLNHAAPKGTFVNVQADRCRQQQLLRRFTATVHKRITSCIRVRADTSLRSAPKHAVHMPLAMPVYTHIYIYIYTYLSLHVQLSQAVRLQIRGHSAPHCQFKEPAATGGTPMDC